MLFCYVYHGSYEIISITVRVTYVSQSGFSVIDVGNHGHVPDVELVVHDGTHLLGGKVHLFIDN